MLTVHELRCKTQVTIMTGDEVGGKPRAPAIPK